MTPLEDIMFDFSNKYCVCFLFEDKKKIISQYAQKILALYRQINATVVFMDKPSLMSAGRWEGRLNETNKLQGK